MDYRPLGSTGIRVSEIGFGCGNVGGLMIRGEHGDQVKAAARAIELGINYFDTAPSYGDGQSEINLGQVLKELSADVYVGTKFRVTTHEPGRIRGNVIASVEESLTRLQREQVDLIQMHNHVASMAEDGSVTPEEALGEAVDALRELREQGKVRFWGMTAVGETAALHRVIDSATLHTVQSVYNLVNPSAGSAVPPGFDYARPREPDRACFSQWHGGAGDSGPCGGSADWGGNEASGRRPERRTYRFRSGLRA